MTRCTLFLMAFSPCSTKSCHRTPQDTCCALGTVLSQGQPGQLQQPRGEQTPLRQGSLAAGLFPGQGRRQSKDGHSLSTALLPGLTSQRGKTSELVGILWET